MEPEIIESLTFESIVFNSVGCLGECPVFGMYIKQDGSAEMHAKVFVEESGYFRTKINPKDLEKLKNKIFKAELSLFKPDTSVFYTCGPDYLLIVKFKNQKRIRIFEHYMKLPKRILLLIDYFDKLRLSQDWERHIFTEENLHE
jgi:hypothetical protein